jgi:CRP-like cAMP-binding protein/predicted MFS family arabinose efflux permease
VTAPPAPAPSLSPYAVFRNRSFAWLWTAQLISTAGSALTSLAAGILVYRVTDSVSAVGLMLIATAAPSLLVGLVAGVFVDRWNRKAIMVAADASRGVIVFVIPFVVVQDFANLGIGWLYLFVALSSVVTQFFDPANDSVLPEIASDEELAAANSLMAISSFGSTAIGFALAGLIAGALPIEWAFWIDAATFAVSAACIGFVRIGHVPPEEDTSIELVWRNLKAGTGFLLSTPILRSLFIVSAPVFLSFGLWNTLLLPFTKTTLGATDFEYGLQEGLTSVGFVVGSLVLANIADRWREGQWLAMGFVMMGAVGIFYGLSPNVGVAIGLVIFSGFFNAPASVGRRLVIQRNTPRDFRGRVNSAFFVTRDVVFLVGMGLAGLADFIDIRLLVILASALLVAAGVWTNFLPGLGQPAAEWRRAMSLLRAAPTAPGLGAMRPATMADFDLLVGYVPALGLLSDRDRRNLIAQSHVTDAAEGTRVLTAGEVGDAAYFILSGRTVAGIAGEEGEYQALSSMEAGDFFGEIAALTGSLRTANVVAEKATTLMEVPAAALRQLMAVPQISTLVFSKLTERLSRTNADLPRLAGMDQETLRDLRSRRSPAEALPEAD